MRRALKLLAAVAAVAIGVWALRVRPFGAATPAGSGPPAIPTEGAGARRGARERAALAREIHIAKLVPVAPATAALAVNVLPDMDMTEELAPAPDWHGPWPETVADLPNDARMRRKLQELGSVRKLNYSLGLLGRLRRCVDASVKSKGGIFVELWFDVDTAGKAVGTHVDVRESSLDPDDDPVVIRCLELEHIGHFFVFESPPTDDPNRDEVQKDGYVIRTVVSVPVRNDPFYAALLGP